MMQSSFTKTDRLMAPPGESDSALPDHADDDETSVYKATPTARWAVPPPGLVSPPLDRAPAARVGPSGPAAPPEQSPGSSPPPSRTKTIPYGVLSFTTVGPALEPAPSPRESPVDSTPPPMLTLMLLVALAMLLASGGLAVTALLELV